MSHGRIWSVRPGLAWGVRELVTPDPRPWNSCTIQILEKMDAGSNKALQPRSGRGTHIQFKLYKGTPRVIHYIRHNIHEHCKSKYTPSNVSRKLSAVKWSMHTRNERSDVGCHTPDPFTLHTLRMAKHYRLRNFLSIGKAKLLCLLLHPRTQHRQGIFFY